MLTRLGRYADKALEAGWLLAIVIVPLFFNVYSSRVFEPDKISLLRSLVLVMLAAWIVKIAEGGYRAWTERASLPTSAANGVPGRARVAAAVDGAARAGLPSWLGVLRVPMLIPIALYALTYLISSLFSVTPDATWWGSYQRLQGTYTQYSYMLLGIMIIANLRTRVQFERMINFMLLTSLPVAAYGLLQGLRLDPLPWAGDTASRVASSMGNAIFVAAWLIMVTPFAAYRIFTGLGATIAARSSAAVELATPMPAPDTTTPAERRRASRIVPAEEPSYGWAVVMAGVGVLFISLFFFYMTLKVEAGMPYPDARTWWVLPLALVVFYASCWLLEAFNRRRDDPQMATLVVPAVGVGLFLVLILAMVFTWSVSQNAAGTALDAHIGLDGGGFLWVVFFLLLWGTIGAGAYALAAGERTAGAVNADRSIIHVALNVGYILLIAVQVLCIYLTQSRGPWLGLGAGFIIFMVALWLVGRRSHVRWMARTGGIVTAISVIIALFVASLNIPGSPTQALGSLPVVGRGLERLSTLTQTDEGTGKVRELIWQGATNLILSDPARAVIGWGPEAMYVAYNPFYPPELAQVELRNATPDRSHNVEFDQMVTTGVLGLFAYYFLVGSFFFLAMKALKRAVGTRDQLLIITLMAAIGAHFIETQTGIQIAATWTYFYIIIAMMVVLAYYLNPYLRPASEQQVATAAGVPGVATIPAEAAVPGDEPRVVAAGKSTGRGATATLAREGNGRGAGNSAGTDSAATRSRSAPTGVTRNPPSRPVGNGNGSTRSVVGADGRRRAVSNGRGYITVPTSAEWSRNPALIVLYIVLFIGALFLSYAWNESGVQADTLYKEGQAYDGAQRWPEAISLYTQAVDRAPNQDYYYLFLGRAWLEFAKQAMTETTNARTGVKYDASESTNATVKAKNDAARKQEQIARAEQSEAILMKAHSLSPLNTDHYANLGRLYLWWGDTSASGGNDPSKDPLAVQYLELAVGRTPGNAQVRDELGVAYAQNGQFQKGIDTLAYSQNSIDPTYASTPFITAQLYQNRLATVRDDLLNKKALPTGGERDYGKLVLDLGRAYSDTLKLDPTTVVDSQYKSRVDSLLLVSQPFTATNTTLSQAEVGNVLTSTVLTSLRGQLPAREKDLADYLQSKGGYTGTANVVPADVLQKLWQNPAWAAVGSDGSKAWSDPSLATAANLDSLVNYAIGYIGSKTGAPGEPAASYARAVALSPNNPVIAQDVTPQK